MAAPTRWLPPTGAERSDPAPPPLDPPCAGVRRAGARRIDLRRGLDAIAAHPRHRLLFAFVAGLLGVPVSRPATVVAAALAAALVAAACHAGSVGGARAGIAALAAAVAVLTGGVVAGQRLAAFEGGALPQLHGRSLAARAVLLEP